MFAGNNVWSSGASTADVNDVSKYVESRLDEPSALNAVSIFNNRIHSIYSPSYNETVDAIKKNDVQQVYGNEPNLIRILQYEEQAVQRAVESLALSIRSPGNPHTCELSNVAWERPSEEQLECIYYEGVSMSLVTPLFLNRERYGTSFKMPSTVLVIRFHVRQLQCLGLNQFWFLERLFQDMVGLGVETTAENNRVFWSSTFQDQSTKTVPWPDMGVFHHVPSNRIPSALEYLASQRPEIKIGHNLPESLAVEFQVEDNLVGIVQNEQDYLGTGHIFRYGKAGKKFKQHGLSLANEADAEAPKEQHPSWLVSLLANSRDQAEEKPETDGWLSTKTNERKSKQEDKVSHYSWTDVIEFHTLSKAGDADELMRKLLMMVDSICETIDFPDEGLYSGNLFRDTNYAAAMNRSPLRRFIITTNPATTYRLACHVFCVYLMLRLRCPQEQTVMSLGDERAQESRGVTVSVKLGRIMTIAPSDNVQAKFRAAKANCSCGLSCDQINWLDEKRDTVMIRSRSKDNPLRDKHGQELTTVASDKCRAHPTHRYMPIDLMWFDKYLKKPLGTFSSENDILASDHTACDLRTGCYQASQCHYFYCPNKIVCYRGHKFRPSLDRSTLSVHNDSGEAARQCGDANAAADTLKASEPLKGSEHMANASVSKMSLRDFATQLTSLVQTLSSIDTKLSRSTVSDGLRMATINAPSFSKLIDTMYLYFPPTLFNEDDTKIMSRRSFNEWYTNKNNLESKETDWGRRRIIGSCMKLVELVGQYRMKTNNAAFCTGINSKQGMYAIRYSIVGARMKLASANRDKLTAGNRAEFHQILAGVDASVVFSDFYSPNGDGENHTADDTDMRFKSFFGDDSTDPTPIMNNALLEAYGGLVGFDDDEETNINETGLKAQTFDTNPDLERLSESDSPPLKRVRLSTEETPDLPQVSPGAVINLGSPF